MIFSFTPSVVFLQSVLQPASSQASVIRDLFDDFHIAAALMLMLVIGLVTYTCLRFKQKANDHTEPKQTTGSTIWEVWMIAVPVVILLYFFYRSVSVEKEVMPPVAAGRKPDVIITGHQWWWEVSYPGANVTTANEVHLPAGKLLLLELRSADVIHDWWVPQLGAKMDLIPLQQNDLWVTIAKPGEYIGACSEFCGTQHAWMRIRVIAETEEKFSDWLKQQAVQAHAPQDELAKRGEVLFQKNTCAGCHCIKGTEAKGTIGPDLTHFGSREQMLTGLLPINEENVVQWISHPQKIKPGAYMPAFHFHKDSIQAISHYLLQLQ
jgi:cytochrome c oxidase subunit 2